MTFVQERRLVIRILPRSGNEKLFFFFEIAPFYTLRALLLFYECFVGRRYSSFVATFGLQLQF